MKALSVTDEADAGRGLYANVQQRIMDEALIIPIRDYVNLNGASSSVKGLRYGLQR